jgi:hypothetical protein
MFWDALPFFLEFVFLSRAFHTFTSSRTSFSRTLTPESMRTHVHFRPSESRKQAEDDEDRIHQHEEEGAVIHRTKNKILLSIPSLNQGKCLEGVYPDERRTD